MITHLKRAALILLFCLTSISAAPSPKSTNSSTIKPTPKMNQVNGIPLALLSSLYRHVEESGTVTKGPARAAWLVFHPSGAAFLFVWKETRRQLREDDPRYWQRYLLPPDWIRESKAYEANFSYNNGKLTLQFDSNDFIQNVTFPLDLAANKVTMPFQVFSPEKGKSTWERNDSEGRLNDIVDKLCWGIVGARKTTQEMTTILLAEYLKPFVHPIGTPAIDVSPAPPLDPLIDFELSGRGYYELRSGELPELNGSYYQCFIGTRFSDSFLPCGKVRFFCTPKGCGCWDESKSHIISGELILTGSCNRASIGEIIGPRIKEVTAACFERELLRNPTLLAGKVEVSFTIKSAGAIDEVNVASTLNKNSEIEDCIRSYILPLSVPESKESGECHVKYTFIN